jgi:glycosyltransferase involved in cell wall biosynthesis
MGCPVVSTSIGIEGLEARENIDFLQRDDAASMAAAIVDLLENEVLRQDLAANARQLVEQRFGHKVAATVFEQICLDTLAVSREGHGKKKIPLNVDQAAVLGN